MGQSSKWPCVIVGVTAPDASTFSNAWRFQHNDSSQLVWMVRKISSYPVPRLPPVSPLAARRRAGKPDIEEASFSFQSWLPMGQAHWRPHFTNPPRQFRADPKTIADARLCLKTQGAGLRAAARANRCVVLHRRMAYMPASDALRIGSFARSRACGRLLRQSLAVSARGRHRLWFLDRFLVYDVIALERLLFSSSSHHESLDRREHRERSSWEAI